MKQFLKYFFLFALLFFLLEKTVWFYIDNAPKKEYDKRLEKIISGKMNKDVVIIGSSLGANNINADLLEVKLDKTVFNLSYRGTDILFHKFLLESLLKFNKAPKKILLVIDDDYQFKDNPFLSFRIDRLMPLKNFNYINEELIKRNKKSVLSKIFLLSRINKKDFSLDSVRPLTVNIMTKNGSKMLEPTHQDTLVYNKELKNYISKNEDKDKIIAFKQIEQLCKLNKIDLYYVFTPSYKRFNNSFFNRIKQLVVNKKNIIKFDTLNYTYNQKQFFRDYKHMFKTGASVFTLEIIKSIQ